MSEYLIKKGNHSSGLHFGVHFGLTEQKYKVRFSKECIYTPDWENDWNKLCGWSYGLHHKNSVRVCWRPEVFQPTKEITGRIELCIYTYREGTRQVSIGTLTVDIEKDFILNLKYIEEQIQLFIEGQSLGLIFRYDAKPSWGYRLYPYIGGDNVATQDTRIYLERL